MERQVLNAEDAKVSQGAKGGRLLTFPLAQAFTPGKAKKKDQPEPPSGGFRENPVGMRCLWKSPGHHPGSPLMGESCSVGLLAEVPDLNSAWCSINISPLRGFSDRLLKEADVFLFYSLPRRECLG